MADAETRALGRAAALLLVASLVRWAWTPGPSPAGVDGPDALPTLLAETRARTADAQTRARPLGPRERLDPNRATEAELDRLPGVGPALAAALARSREEKGPFRSAEELLRVKGIGPALLARVRPHLELGPTPVGLGGRSASARAGKVPVGGGPASPLDVNRADSLALQALPGVGPALARRIVEARTGRPFASVDDLLRVRGIGPVTLERLRPLVTTGS